MKTRTNRIFCTLCGVAIICVAFYSLTVSAEQKGASRTTPKILAPYTTPDPTPTNTDSGSPSIFQNQEKESTTKDTDSNQVSNGTSISDHELDVKINQKAAEFIKDNWETHAEKITHYLDLLSNLILIITIVIPVLGSALIIWLENKKEKFFDRQSNVTKESMDFIKDSMKIFLEQSEKLSGLESKIRNSEKTIKKISEENIKNMGDEYSNRIDNIREEIALATMNIEARQYAVEDMKKSALKDVFEKILPLVEKNEFKKVFFLYYQAFLLEFSLRSIQWGTEHQFIEALIDINEHVVPAEILPKQKMWKLFETMGKEGRINTPAQIRVVGQFAEKTKTENEFDAFLSQIRKISPVAPTTYDS